MSTPDVALVAPYPRAGAHHEGSTGVASYTANLAQALAGRGADVHVVAPRDDGGPRIEADGAVTVHRLFRPGPAAVPRAVVAAASTGAPVVHVQHELFLFGGASSIPALVPSLALLRSQGRGPVVTMHQVVDPVSIDRGYARLHRIPLPAPVARGCLSGLQRAVGAAAGRCIVHEEGFTDAITDAVVIPHGIEPGVTPARAAARRRLGLDGFVALCFGFVAPYKGFELVLAAGEVAGDDIHVVVAGGAHPRFARPGGYLDQLAAMHPTARFAGYVPDDEVASWFAAADVVVLPYPRPHASSGVLALALAHGTPLLMSPALAASCGAPEALVVPTRPAKLAARLGELAADPGAPAALGAAAAPLRAGRSWNEVAAAHLDLYAEVA